MNTDFSIIKHFALPREGMRLDFRTEFFNLFNHPQFGSPGGNGVGADFNSSYVCRDQLHGEQSAPGSVRSEAGVLTAECGSLMFEPEHKLLDLGALPL